MQKVIFLLFSLFLLSECPAQKIFNDPYVTPREVAGFHTIEVSSGIELFISNGEEAAAVSAKDENVRARIKTTVNNGVLKIWYEWKEGKKYSLARNQQMKAYVSYKMLHRLSAAGGSDVNVDGIISADKLEIHVSGGSVFSGQVDVADLVVNQSGGADVNISGSAANLVIQASGGSDFDGYDLASSDATISASGGSDIQVTVNKKLDAEASGGSDINWKGSAMIKKAKASGAGSISRRS